MKSPDDRINELEQRIAYLESIVMKSQTAPRGFVTSNIVNPNIGNPPPINQGIGNPNMSNSMGNPNMVHPNMVTPNMATPNVATPNVANPKIINPNMAHPNMINSNIGNSNVGNFIGNSMGNPNMAHSIQNQNSNGYVQPPYSAYGNQQAWNANQFASRSGQSFTTHKLSKSSEALVGKYIIGILASLLIFFAATSFVGLMWNKITPEIKLFLIFLAGFIITVLGFRLVLTKKNTISSIILGTGAGLLYIAILSGNIGFHLIGNDLSILLAGVWAIIFILSSRFCKLYFTTVIAYIGSYIALILGMTLMEGDRDLWVLIFFAACISGAIIYNALSNREKKAELIASVILSLVSFCTISFRCYIDGAFWMEPKLNHFIAETLLIFIIYLLMNILYRLLDKLKAIPIYLLVSIIVSVLSILYIDNLSTHYFHLDGLGSCLLFLAMNIIQLFLSNLMFSHVEKWLTRYYTILSVVTMILINQYLYEVPTGIVVIGLLLILIERLFKRSNHSLLIGIITLQDAIFLCFAYTEKIYFLLFGILQILMLLYILWRSHGLKKYHQLTAIKILGLMVMILNCYGIVSTLLHAINAPNISMYTKETLGFALTIGAVILLIRFNYFKNWKEENYKIFSSKGELKEDLAMEITFYILLTFLYFIGLLRLAIVDIWYLQMVFTLGTIVAALLQSKKLLARTENNFRILAGIWIIFKYLLLSWTILGAFSNLSISSVLYSIVGLVIAIASILVGLKLRNKYLRLYGLFLTILMVAKFILVDLMEENSITRVIALIAGGAICFIISYIYNKINVSIED